MAYLNQHSWEKKDLSGQNLKTLPQDLVTHVSLCTSLDLQRNKLKRVMAISRFINLTELNLSRNKIIEFPLEMHNMHKLETLLMNQNNIRSIPEGIFPHLRKLKFLKLSTNRLAKLPSDMNQCSSIIYLDLSKNYLQDIQILVGLPRLNELWVEKNQLSEIPSQLFMKDSCELTVFQAAGNPLRCPPEEVCAGGVTDIQSYFIQIEKNPNTHTAWTVKVMFLGSSMAGKSTLCRSMREGKPVAVAVKDRTEGIDITQLYSNGVRFLLWDFAGQEEYYLTHHVFITPRALVILTVDLASYSIENPDSFKDQLWFWIKNIQLRVPDALVMLVGTHCDQCRDLDEVMEKKTDIEKKVQTMLENRKTVLKQQKKNLEEKDSSLYIDQVDELDCLLDYNLKVLDLVTLDCTASEDIAKLRSHILDCIQSESARLCFESILPKSYEEVEQAIPKLIALEDIPKHGIILFEEMGNLISSHVTQSREHLNSILSVLLRYLHRIGVIIWYEDISALSDRVFIQPSFLISIFKTIVRHDLIQQLEGISRNLLMQEGALVKQKFTWLDDLRCRGILHNAAMRILMRREVEKLIDDDDDDLVREIVGTKQEEGIILTLLQYFEVCLPTLVRSPMNPEGAEFIPGKTKWETNGEAKRDPNGACLFPMYLKNNLTVCHKWGEDKQEDITVHVYFLPEIPYGFFHRMIIKTCSLYPTHWVGKDECLLCCGNRLAMVRQRNKDGDSFIEIRCRRPEKNEEFQQMWDLILAVMSKLFVLSRQWPGLTQQVHTPCPERGCSHYFTWKDWQELHGTDLYSLVKEEKIVCQGGHTRRTELIFPKGK